MTTTPRKALRPLWSPAHPAGCCSAQLRCALLALLALLVGAACSSNGGGPPSGDATTDGHVAADGRSGDVGDSGDGSASGVRATGGSGGQLGASLQTMSYGGNQRNFAVHVPPSYSDKTAVPLVIHFHGWRPLPAGIADEVAYVWADEADAEGFIAVAPEGVSCPELNPNGDPYGCFRDPGFAKALLAHLGDLYNIDLDRVYLSGHSGGAYFTQQTGIGGADVYAAAAGFSGGCISASDQYGNSCSVYVALSQAAKRKIPYFVIHGNADQVVPVQYSADLLKLVLKPGNHPTAVYPAKPSDVYDGGKYGHSVDVRVVPKVWTWLSQYTLGR